MTQEAVANPAERTPASAPEPQLPSTPPANPAPPAPANENPPATPPASPPSTEGTPPATPPVTQPAANEKPQLTPEAIAEAQRLIERNNAARAEREAQDKADDELRALLDEAPDRVRALMDDLEEFTESRIPADKRKPLLDFIKSLTSNATKAAELKLGKSHTQALESESAAFVDACYASIDPAKSAAFTAEVHDQPYEVWVKAVQKYAPSGGPDVPGWISEANAWGADAANGLNEAEQAQLSADLKGLKTTKAVIKAVEKAVAAREARRPGAAPTGGERAAPVAAGAAKLADRHTPISEVQAGLAAAGVKF